MNDEDLIGYVLDALNPAERDAVAASLRARPELAVRAAELRRALAPLEADREPPPVPSGLALRTVARLAARLAGQEAGPAASADPAAPAAVARALTAAEPDERPLAFPTLPRAPREQPEARAVGGRFRPDLIVACGIALFATGLVISAVGKSRVQSQLLACQGNLRTLHTGLAGYADTHGGRYPQIGTTATPTADTFVPVLADAGQLPASFRPCCPADTSASPAPPGTSTPAVATPPVGYTYTLGYRSPAGGLLGLRRTDGGEDHDLVPISADLPTATAAPADGRFCPHAVGMNVLYAGGHVRHTTSALVGPNRDHIYLNLSGRVAAGADRTDTVLGRPGDVP